MTKKDKPTIQDQMVSSVVDRERSGWFMRCLWLHAELSLTQKWPISATLDLDEMTYDPDTCSYSAPCRCGGCYVISEGEMDGGVDTVNCSTCTLSIRVLYQDANDDDQWKQATKSTHMYVYTYDGQQQHSQAGYMMVITIVEIMIGQCQAHYYFNLLHNNAILPISELYQYLHKQTVIRSSLLSSS